MGGDGGAREAFEQLKEKLKEISCLEGVASLLSWDQQVYMPPNGVATRGAQQGVIARVAHAHKTSDAIGAALELSPVQSLWTGALRLRRLLPCGRPPGSTIA